MFTTAAAVIAPFIDLEDEKKKQQQQATRRRYNFTSLFQKKKSGNKDLLLLRSSARIIGKTDSVENQSSKLHLSLILWKLLQTTQMAFQDINRYFIYRSLNIGLVQRIGHPHTHTHTHITKAIHLDSLNNPTSGLLLLQSSSSSPPPLYFLFLHNKID